MRTLVIAALFAAGCGGAPPPTRESAPTEKPLPPLATTTQIPKAAPAPPTPDAPLPPPRVFPVAWHTAKAGKSTVRGDGVAFRTDGSLAVIGQGEAERWTKKPTKKLAKRMPHFIASLDASGKPEWVRTIDVGNGWTDGLAGGPDGSMIVAGSFVTSLRIEGKVVATATGDSDVFVARFERDGRLAWVTRVGGTALDLVNDIAVTADGTSYIVGSISGEATFGALVTRHAGDRDVFLAALDPTGQPQWVSTAGGTDSDEARAVTLTPSGVCVTGYFGGVAKFQSITLTMPPPEPNKVANPSNAFVVCHAKSGDVQWAQRIGTHTSFDRGWDIAALTDGSVVVTGDYDDRAFVASYSAAGTQQWLRHSKGDGTARAVVALPGDEILVATYFSNGELALPGRKRTIKVSTRAADTVLAHYTPAGEILGAGRIAGAKPGSGTERDMDEVEIGHIAVSSTARVALTGRVWGSGVFEPGDLLKPSTDKITGPSGTDLILVVLDPLQPAP